MAAQTSHLRRLVAFVFTLCAPIAHSDTCIPDTFSQSENSVLSAYVAYYGRPADHGGLSYWADRMASEGGSLNEIIEAFGNEREFVERYGGRTDTELVTGIYQQLFGRPPETGGLTYYVGELSAGRRSLQSIALDILFGAQGSDAAVVTQRLVAARHFTAHAAAPAIDPLSFDADAMTSVLASVDATSESSARACHNFDAMLKTVGALTYSKRLTVRTTADSNNSVCRSDCSLRDAINEANATAGPVLIDLPSGVYTLTHPEGDLFITGNIHLRGMGTESSVIDGNGQTRLFWLENTSAQLILSELTLRNGYQDFGGAILSKGSLILDRIAFSDNATPSNGGALLNVGTLHSFSTDFSGNTAAGSGFGGALFNEGGTAQAHLHAGHFFANHAAHSGGAVYSSAPLFATNTLFNDNSAGETGGAIESTGPVTLANAYFKQNMGNDGGAIGLHAGGVLTARSTTFHDNLANGLDLGGGGAIFSYNGNIDLTDTHFTANIADNEGGGAIQSRGRLTIRNSTFQNNLARIHDTVLVDSADGFGGALLIIDGSTVVITDTTFNDNIAGNTGGAIYIDRFTTVTLTNTTLDRNTAQGLFSGGASGYGGAIHNEGTLNLADTSLSSNQAKEAGGGISLNQNAELSATRVSLLDNSASNGGAIAAYTGNLHLADSILARNRATKSSDGFGGAILIGSAQTSIHDSTLQSNQAAIGGAFSNNGGGTISILRSMLTGNSASVDGSAFINFAGGRVELGNSTLSGSYKNHPGSTFTDLGGNSFLP